MNIIAQRVACVNNASVSHSVTKAASTNCVVASIPRAEAKRVRSSAVYLAAPPPRAASLPVSSPSACRQSAMQAATSLRMMPASCARVPRAAHPAPLPPRAPAASCRARPPPRAPLRRRADAGRVYASGDREPESSAPHAGFVKASIETGAREQRAARRVRGARPRGAGRAALRLP
jgi:hypothetical protein